VFGGAGCTSATDTANRINSDIHATTVTIVHSATQAKQHIADADGKLAAATTQSANPPATTELVIGARGDLALAQQSLAPIASAAAHIEKKSDEAAAVTKKAVDETNKVKSGWGYRVQRFVHLTFWTLVIAAPILAVGVFAIRTNGGGPLTAALGEIAGNIIRAAWAVVKFVGRALFHLVTLGAGKLADITNKHYDQQQFAKAAAPPVASVNVQEFMKP
jgi:hypothetical protein